MAINSDELVHFWDHAFRSLLRNPQRLRTVVELCDPDLAARLDFGSATILERTYLTDAYREREADLLFKLNYRAADGLREASPDRFDARDKRGRNRTKTDEQNAQFPFRGSYFHGFFCHRFLRKNKHKG